MTRILAFAAAALALLAWLNVRDLLARSSGSAQAPDPADDVQPPDPVTVRHSGACMCQTCRDRFAFGGVMGPVRPFIVGESGPERLEPLSERDRDWLDQTVRASLYPST